MRASLWAAALVALGAGSASAGEAFLKVDCDTPAFVGDSTDAGHAGWFDVEELVFSVQRSRDPKVAVLKSSEPSKDFENAFKTRRKLRTLTIELVPTGTDGASRRPKLLVLRDARVASIEPAGEGRERIHFAYKRLETTAFDGGTATYGLNAGK